MVQDPALNELLPFGEYVAPERLSSATAPHFMVGLDAWELEHLLHRLVRAQALSVPPTWCCVTDGCAHYANTRCIAGEHQPPVAQLAR